MVNNVKQTQLMIVTGLSGSGKSVALNTLEDLGYYCIDNLPAALVLPFIDHCSREAFRYRKLALGLDLRSEMADPTELVDVLSTVRHRIEHTKVLFFEAANPVLIKRYSETRRRHPMAHGKISLTEAIIKERDLMLPIAESADVTLDTSDQSVHQLRRDLCNAIGSSEQPLALLIESFAFKRGVPADVDFAFDARCLPNPHWKTELRPFTGRDPQVRKFLEQHDIVEEFASEIKSWLERWLPRFETDGRSYITVGIGCTGGKHRSVYIAETLSEHFRSLNRHVLSYHRELM